MSMIWAHGPNLFVTHVLLVSVVHYTTCDITPRNGWLILQEWPETAYTCTLGPLHTRDWEPVTIALQALSLVTKAEPVQVLFTQRSRNQRSMWMHGGCKVYVDTYMASNGSCFMVTWTLFKNHCLEVGLTQNWETMALRTLTTVDLFYFIMCDDPCE